MVLIMFQFQQDVASHTFKFVIGATLSDKCYFGVSTRAD